MQAGQAEPRKCLDERALEPYHTRAGFRRPHSTIQTTAFWWPSYLVGPRGECRPPVQVAEVQLRLTDSIARARHQHLQAQRRYRCQLPRDLVCADNAMPLATTCA